MKTVAIIGAGAAGLSCLKTLVEYKGDFHIQLFDRNRAIGKKISATGNGHCNLSNANLTLDAYQGDILPLQDVITSFDIESFCHDLGFLVQKKGALYYPFSLQAKTVVNAFDNLIHNYKVDLKLDTTIQHIIPLESGYQLVDQHQNTYKADIVVVAAGAKAGKGFGTDGQIFDVLKELNLHATKLRPSLVSLVTKENVKKLKGCRFHGIFTLKNNDIEIASYKGEALITEDGISGISCMQLSRFLEFDQNARYTLHCNLIEDLNDEQLVHYYNTYGAKFDGIVLDKLAEYLSYKEVNSFKEFKAKLNDLTFHITNTRGFEFAQVTKGGIPLNYLNSHLMVKQFPNIYLCGEILNVDGDCGGYNLHFAFATGQYVAYDIVQHII